MSTETQLAPLKFHLVNAFAPTPHSGNQAAVVLFPKDDPRVLDEAYLQSLAVDFNYADSAFVVPVNADAHPPEYSIRWFTPTTVSVKAGSQLTLRKYLSVAMQRLRPRSSFSTMFTLASHRFSSTLECAEMSSLGWRKWVKAAV